MQEQTDLKVVSQESDGDKQSSKKKSYASNMTIQSRTARAPPLPEPDLSNFPLDPQQATLFTTLLMRHQQRESARQHKQVSKPVKPHVADSRDGDQLLLESNPN